MALPLIQSSNPDLMQVETKWKSQLDPLLSSPLGNGLLLQGIVLATGSNTINHGLGRALRGWFVVRSNASATFYDNQDNNRMTNLTLVLVASAPATISLWVF
jgi:hypothetical protein